VALGINVDSIPSKTAWAKSLGVDRVEFLSDFEPKGRVAKEYGIYRDGGFSERAVFIVDKKGIVIFARVYPISQKPDLSEIIPVLPA
jgi:alkyl hydroperoxide reductase subunit AhpC